MTLVDNFNKAFPDYEIADFYERTSIVEHSNDDNGKFKELEITGFKGFSFHEELAGKLTSFPNTVGHKGCLLKNCDGIHLFIYNGEKYLMLSELKSSFNTDEIAKAKDQLIGTYINLMAVLRTLQNFDSDDYHIFGVIAAYKPSDEDLSAISKREDKKSAFAIQLNANNKYFMPASRCLAYYHPLNVGDFTIAYVPVTYGADKYSIDILDILNKIN